MKRGKYKRQIYNTFMIIFTLLIMVFAGIFFKSTMNKNINERETFITNVIKTNINSSQLKFEVINNAIESVANSTAMSNWEQSESLTDYYFQAIRVQKEIASAVSKVNSVEFELAATYFDREGFVLTPFASESKNEYFLNTLKFSDEKIEEIFEHFEIKNDYLVFTIERIKGQPEICYITKELYSKREILFITTIKYATFMDKSDEYEWYLSRKNNIFAGEGQLDRDKLSQSFIENREEEYFTYNDKKIYPQYFSNIDWQALYVYDDNNLTSSMLLIYLLFPMIGLYLIAMILTNYITRFLYKPMKEVMNDYGEDSNEKNIDEFSVLKKNSNMISTLNQQLKIALSEKNTLLEQRYSRELLLGIKINQKKYPEEWFEDGNYAVATIEFMLESVGEDEEDLFIYKNDIISYIHDNQLLRYVALNYFTYAIIIKTDNQKDAISLLNEMLETIDDKSEREMRISLSDIRMGISKIPKCYEESSKILEYKYLYYQGTILTMEQVKSFNKETYYFPLLIENKLIHSVLAGDVIALTLYDQLVYQNDTNLNLSPEAFKNLIFALLGMVRRIIQELKVDAKDILGQNFDVTELSYRWNEETISDEIREIIKKMINYVKTSKENNESKLEKQMLEFVHKHYTEDIMLIDLAELLNVSEKYCGILFKKMVGVNYKSYLNEFRIEQAKEIIYKDPEVKIADLAKWVGFNSSNTFIRVFTKYTGLTPKRYSEEYQVNRKLKK